MCHQRFEHPACVRPVVWLSGLADWATDCAMAPNRRPVLPLDPSESEGSSTPPPRRSRSPLPRRRRQPAPAPGSQAESMLLLKGCKAELFCRNHNFQAGSFLFAVVDCVGCVQGCSACPIVWTLVLRGVQTARFVECWLH